MSGTILSIQSSVACGHVGNAAAAFILQRLGFDVIRLDTVLYSNHPGLGTFRGHAVSPESLEELVLGLQEQGFFARTDSLLSGYLGKAANGAMVLKALERLRHERPDALFCCDPVMGDLPKGLYVDADIPGVVRDMLVPHADIVTPNLFELNLLTGASAADRASAVEAARALIARGPSTIVVTGVPVEGRIETLAVQERAAWFVSTPVLALPTSGAGDALTALFFARYIEKANARRALSLSVSALHCVLERTLAMKAFELRLIDCQDLFATPPEIFSAEMI